MCLKTTIATLWKGNFPFVAIESSGSGGEYYAERGQRSFSHMSSVMSWAIFSAPLAPA
jgi:hypothetical protein